MKPHAHQVKNRFGTYYDCVVFPVDIRAKINKEQASRSLRTKDPLLASVMAREFQQIAEWIFNQIRYSQNKRVSQIY